MDPLKPIKPGDALPTSTRTWNPMMAAARAAKPGPLFKRRKLPTPTNNDKLTIQIPAGGIPAMTGYKPGKADCPVMVLVVDPDPSIDPEFKTNGETETVYNWSASVIGDTGYRIGKARFEDGVWQITAADCEDERSFVAAESV